MEEDIMCKREEVEHIVDKATRDIREDIKELRHEHEVWQKSIAEGIDKRIGEVARSIVSEEKKGLFQYIGWGGLIGVAGIIYFFGGLTNQVANLQLSLDELKKEQQEINEWVNSGNLNLKSYVDQQDEAILTQLKDGFDDLKVEIRSIK